MSPPSSPRVCWCGAPGVPPDFGAGYGVCRACGTLVSRAAPAVLAPAVDADAGGLYGKDYWLKRQPEHHGLPDLAARARLDLPERCVHWLRQLLAVRLPPARVLEIGCAHGGYVALLNWAGFTATGTELSPWVAGFARQTFGVDVAPGPVEAQSFAAASLDVIVLNDVLEHLPDPVATLGHCARLLRPGGFFVMQTPEYKEHLAYADLRATGDLFLKHIEHNQEEHLYLFSRRSAGIFFGRLGFPVLDFANPVYAYDMFFTASREPLPRHGDQAVAMALMQTPVRRLVLALLDKTFESNDRWWAMQRLEAELEKRPPAEIRPSD